MKISELKEIIEKFAPSVASEHKKYAERLLNLFDAENIDSLVSSSNPEDLLMKATKKAIYAIFTDFWQEIVTHLPEEQWESTKEVQPWCQLQNELINRGFEDAHHPQLYQQYARTFSLINLNVDSQVDSKGESKAAPKVDLKSLVELLILAARLIGYATEKEIDGYPDKKITENIINKSAIEHEKQKLKIEVTMLAVLSILLNEHCCAEQIVLLKKLSTYRPLTTKEEKTSEQKIITWLTAQPFSCQAFFTLLCKDYFDRSQPMVNGFTDLLKLLPSKNNAILTSLCEPQWLKILLKRCKSSVSEIDIGGELFLDFATLKNHSYQAALSFTHSLKSQLESLNKTDRIKLNQLLYSFCLHAYERDRKNDPNSSGFFSFSQQTKLNTALKKIKSLNNIPTEFGFKERLALKQGRLGDLTSEFEEETTSEKPLNQSMG